ncbi:hypothetical protein HGRIS_004005 [Hohenbuehelia grisea]|uniref:N-acetyltransferase domain-containing protein n=1 Tax=Hohenbuehelia grisea TaxID=104357 RepID=A0ABR3JIB4_9AGAR
MSFVNLYKPPQPKTFTTAPPAEPYDINFAYPLPLETFQTSKVKLTPFLPHVHADPFWTATVKALADSKDRRSVDVWRYMPWTLSHVEEMLPIVEDFRSSPEWIMFAVLDKQKLEGGAEEGDCVAGVVGLVGASHVSRIVEIGPVITLPAYQGQNFAKHAVGLLLRYVLDRETGQPGVVTPGLGFRRVQWTAHADNGASIRCAESLGFEREALVRWSWVLDETKEGRPVDCDGRGGRMGRNSTLLVLCWDDWENGVRDTVVKILES